MATITELDYKGWEHPAMAPLRELFHTLISPHEQAERNIIVKFVFSLNQQQYGPLIISMSAVIWVLGFKQEYTCAIWLEKRVGGRRMKALLLIRK